MILNPALKTALVTLMALALFACGGGSGGGGNGQTPSSPSTPTTPAAVPATATQISDAISATRLPKGPDAIGGLSNAGIPDIGDYLLENGFLRAVIDQPGTDPTSFGGVFPLANGIALSGGSLVDLATTADNDQWNQMIQGVAGFRTLATGASGSTNAPSANRFTDGAAAFVTNGVAAGGTLSLLSGLNTGLSLRIAAVISETQLVLFVPPGASLATDTNVDFAVTDVTSPFENQVVYDSASIVTSDPAISMVRVTGGIVHLDATQTPPDGTTINAANNRLLSGGNPVSVETDYFITKDSLCLQVETRVSHTGGAAIALNAISDIVSTGIGAEPDLLSWAPLTGFSFAGLSSTTIVPFAGFQGRNEPGASYAIVDSVKGQIAYSAATLYGVNTQLTDPGSVLDASSTMNWSRQLCVGDENNIASAADKAIALLSESTERVNPDNGSTQPNGYSGVVQIRGSVMGAPPGTRVSAIQVSPALVFDPGLPAGVTSEAGFYSSTLLGTSELIINQTRPNSTGQFTLKVPATFPGLSPNATASPDLTVPSGLESGTTNLAYRILVEAPGLDPQSVIQPVSGSSVIQLPDVFDFGSQLATVNLTVTDSGAAALPAKVVIIGIDPDDTGPIPSTPNPTLGTPPSSNTSGKVDPRAEGTGNVVYLLDGVGSIRLAPGAYQLIASRGIEYSAARFPASAAVTDYFLLNSGQALDVDLQLTRLLDSAMLPNPGGGTFVSPLQRHIAADFHVHSGGSPGAATPSSDLLTAYLATGVEYLAITDRDQITGLGSALVALDSETALDISTMIATQSGVEAYNALPVNIPAILEFANTTGTFNAWPVPRDTTQRRNGAPADEYRSPANLYEQLRLLTPPATVVQMNQPRFPVFNSSPLLSGIQTGPGFFTNHKAGFPIPSPLDIFADGYEHPLTSGSAIANLLTPRTADSTRYIDFDALEIYSGDIESYDASRLDWYALLSAGLVKTATANSSIDDYAGITGTPVNFIYTAGDPSNNISAVDLDVLSSDVLPSIDQATPVLNGTNTARSGASGNAMELTGSSGPVVFIEVDADEDGVFEAQPGDLVFDDGDGSIDIQITVLAAPWVPVNQVVLIQNGGNLASSISGNNGVIINLAGSLTPDPTDPFSTSLADVVRVRTVITRSIAGGSDDWIIVEARSTTSGSVYDQLVPNRNLDPVTNAFSVPLGFSNPIFISDANDGDWDPNMVP